MQHPDLKSLDEAITRAVEKREMLVHRLTAFQSMVKDAKIYPPTADFPHSRVRFSIPFLLAVDQGDEDYVRGYKDIVARYIPDMTFEAYRLFNHESVISETLLHPMPMPFAMAVDTDLIKLCGEIIDGKYGNLISESNASKVMPGDTGMVLLYEVFCVNDANKTQRLVPTVSLTHVKANKKREYELAKYIGEDGKYKEPYIYHMVQLPRP